MNKLELKAFLETNNAGGYKTREVFFIKNFPELALEINEYHNKYFKSCEFNWKLKIYNYINDVIVIPICKNSGCNKSVNFDTNKNRYSEYCSNKCVGASNDVRNKREKTSLRIYGFKNPMKNSIISEKAVKTFNRKKCENPTYLNDINEKRQITWKNIYGVDNPNKHDDVKKKRRKTCVIKYNSNTNLGTDDTIKKTIITCNEKYGCDNPMKNEEIKNKLNDTNIVKYGKKRYLLTEEYIGKNKINNKNKAILIFSKLIKIDETNIEINENDELKISNYCKVHPEFIISKRNVYNRVNQKISNICTLCNPINDAISIGERDIKSFIENDLNIATEKIKINGKEIDIYSSKHRIGIEYNGLYWHSSKFKEKNYHIDKSKSCEFENIQLLHVFEDEWLLKQEIVKSIIKSKLNIINNKIFARKCNIKEIDSKTSAEFLNENHIQGNINSKVKIGLFYNEELVSIMTFGKKRIAMGNKAIVDGEYEMLRFCNKLNTQVIGGAGKLLDYFIKTYSPKSILTFADRRYSNGSLYRKLGFKFIGNTKPNYYYLDGVNSLNRKHRFKYRKDVLVREGYDSNKTEFQIMGERGYLRIYDCGHMKFIWINNKPI